MVLGVMAFCIALASSAQFFSNNRPAEQQAPANDLQQNIQKLVMASVMINNAYVDSVDTKKMVEDAINGILSKLILTLPIPMLRKQRNLRNHWPEALRV